MTDKTLNSVLFNYLFLARGSRGRVTHMVLRVNPRMPLCGRATDVQIITSADTMKPMCPACRRVLDLSIEIFRPLLEEQYSNL